MEVDIRYDSYTYVGSAKGLNAMKTVQMTLDEDLIREVDRLAKKIGTNRSAFTRKALQAALLRFQEMQQEERHRRGYLQRPVAPDEFDGWEDEQFWGE